MAMAAHMQFAGCVGGGVASVARQGWEREFAGLKAVVGWERRVEQGRGRVRDVGRRMEAVGGVGRMGAVRAGMEAGEMVKMPSKQKIRIKLRSYWVPLIEQACKQILEAATNTNSQTMGPVPLPTKRRLYCLLRSPHVDKDSREHFEIRTHRRLIDLENPTTQTIDALMQLDLPAGVDVEVKLT